MASNQMQVLVQSPDSQALESEARLNLDAATNLVIASEPQYREAGEMLSAVKKRMSELEKMRKDITVPLDAAKKKIMDLFRVPQDIYATVETKLKRSMLDYQGKIEAARRAEEARLAELARAEAEALRAEADWARLTGEDDAADALNEQAEALPVSVEIIAPPVKAAGTSIRENWKAEVTDKMALIQHVAANPAMEWLLEPNMQMLNGLAKSEKDALAIPGVKAVCEKILAARRA